ncbi:MAG: siphovirus ReqiPepy6 Gp37-like family protein [Bacillota bacterium]
MKPIRVLTPTLDLLAEIDDYESLVFARCWHKPGEFSLNINHHKHYVDKLVKGNLIMLGSDPFKVGMIKHLEIGLNEQGKFSESWQIRGHTLAGLTYRRIILPPAGQEHDAISGTAETAMKHYIETCLTNPLNPARRVDLLAIGSNQSRGSNVNWQSRYRGLADELQQISLLTGLGWLIYLDFQQTRWIFDVLEGRNLTAGQSVNPRVIFSAEFDGMKTQAFVDSDLNYRNVAYVAGQGEGLDRIVVEVPADDPPIGLARIETFIDARDVENPANLTARGEQKLAEMSIQQALEAQILTKGPFLYERDWDLGDVVTVQNKGWGITMDARITEVKEIYEPGGFKLEVTFGNSWPTLIDKIKQQLGQMDAEIRR